MCPPNSAVRHTAMAFRTRWCNSGSGRASWPSSVSALGQPIEIDHRRRETTSILLEVINNIFSYRKPGSDSTTALTQTRITDNARAYRLIADTKQVVAENFVHEALLGLAFDVN